MILRMAAGNALVSAMADALREAGLEAYHDKGDESCAGAMMPKSYGLISNVPEPSLGVERQICSGLTERT